ncbi:MAG: hypothetical protein HC896_00220 [Bacteroidales bacterium]|nr:hypothetical protein [Bacteroidales bacterium]
MQISYIAMPGIYRQANSPEMIQKHVAAYFNMEVEQMHKNSRKREVVQARQIAMYFSKNKTKCSYAKIGEIIGGKDHATVLHACKTVNNLIETDRQFRQQIEEIETRFNYKF